jgi:hypothetical protein
MNNTPQAELPARNLVPSSANNFYCGQVSPIAGRLSQRDPDRRGPLLWYAAFAEPEHARNEERDQGDDEYDLCCGERGSGHDAEAERARDQPNMITS